MRRQAALMILVGQLFVVCVAGLAFGMYAYSESQQKNYIAFRR
jgi:hypothetical protein